MRHGRFFSWLLVLGLLWGSSVALAAPCCSTRGAAESARSAGTPESARGGCHEMAKVTGEAPLAGPSRVADSPQEPLETEGAASRDFRPCGMICHLPALGAHALDAPRPLDLLGRLLSPSPSRTSLLLPLGLEHVPLA